MIKSLPAIEKEFDMKEVEKANPGWVRVVLGMFVLVVIMTSVWVDWARAGSFFQEAVQSWNQFKHDYGEYQKMDPFDKHGNLQQGNIRNYMEEKSSGTTQTETIRKNKNTVVHTPGKGPKTKCFPTTKVKTVNGTKMWIRVHPDCQTTILSVYDPSMPDQYKMKMPQPKKVQPDPKEDWLKAIGEWACGKSGCQDPPRAPKEYELPVDEGVEIVWRKPL